MKLFIFIILLYFNLAFCDLPEIKKYYKYKLKESVVIEIISNIPEFEEEFLRNDFSRQLIKQGFNIIERESGLNVILKNIERDQFISDEASKSLKFKGVDYILFIKVFEDRTLDKEKVRLFVKMFDLKGVNIIPPYEEVWSLKNNYTYEEIKTKKIINYELAEIEPFLKRTAYNFELYLLDDFAQINKEDSFYDQSIYDLFHEDKVKTTQKYYINDKKYSYIIKNTYKHETLVGFIITMGFGYKLYFEDTIIIHLVKGGFILNTETTKNEFLFYNKKGDLVYEEYEEELNNKYSICFGNELIYQKTFFHEKTQHIIGLSGDFLFFESRDNILLNFNLGAYYKGVPFKITFFKLFWNIDTNKYKMAPVIYFSFIFLK